MYIETKFTPRFCDTDAAGHINNTAVTEWLEAGRMDLYTHHMPPGVKAMMRRLELDYDREMSYRDEVTIRTGVEKIGEKSVTLLQEVWQDGVCRAKAKAIECFFDPETRKSALIPPLYREAYLTFVMDDSSAD